MYVNTVKDGTGDNYWLVGDSFGRMIPGLPFTPVLQSDVGLNDSDKSFPVLSDTEWIVRSIRVKLTTTGTAGNRQIVVEYLNGGVVIVSIRVGVVQAASLTRYYQLYENAPDLTAFRDTDYLTTPLPPNIVLPEGYSVRVYDRAAVDAAADDMEVQMLVGIRGV